MQNQVEEAQITFDDLSSFNLFQIDDLIKDTESIENNKQIEEEDEEIDEEKEDDETEAMKKLRSYPNVAFSRFNFPNNTKENNQSPHSSPIKDDKTKPITENKSPLMRSVFTQVLLIVIKPYSLLDNSYFITIIINLLPLLQQLSILQYQTPILLMTPFINQCLSSNAISLIVIFNCLIIYLKEEPSLCSRCSIMYE